MARDVPSGGSGVADHVIPNLSTVKEVWNVWQIHVLMVASLVLQVILFFFAWIRRRSSSIYVRGALWLVYLSADWVAIFVLGNLAVYAEGPRHHLMYFWAPFVLLHLGGQDTITAFSRQDNELWMRHVLSWVTQVAVAGYVVGRASWPDNRLRAAMIIMFLLGCFKYAERTLYLYFSSPQLLSSDSVRSLEWTLKDLEVFRRRDSERLIAIARGEVNEEDYDAREYYDRERVIARAKGLMESLLDKMKGGTCAFRHAKDPVIFSIISDDAPHSTEESILIEDHLPVMLKEFKSHGSHYQAYEYVGSGLVQCYQHLHTRYYKRTLDLRTLLIGPLSFFDCIGDGFWGFEDDILPIILYLYIVFCFVSTPVALALFMAADKGDQDHTSRADVVVSYILLAGAINLDACSFLAAHIWIRNMILRLADRLWPGWSKKHWSQDLAQYNMIRTATRLSDSKPSLRQCREKLTIRFFGFGTTMHTPATESHTPIQKLILDHLLCFGERKEWDVTNSRGNLALQKWMDSHPDPNSTRIGAALKNSIGDVDFPISVVIWHIATDMICYHEDNSTDAAVKKEGNMQVSIELSNYIMYLVFKCGVTRTTSSQHVHNKALGEISNILQLNHHKDEKDAVRELFGQRQSWTEKSSTDSEEQGNEEQDSEVVEGQQAKQLPDAQDSTVTEIHKPSSNLKQLALDSLVAVGSPILPRAREVAGALNDIKVATERWRLIFEVWSEMLYYIAPRCGSAFHYEHLSTGGELITHLLCLIKLLGPFLPHPGA